MTLAGYLNSQFSLAQNLDFVVRMLVACACGAVIGLERSRRFKEAGVRTHIIVCCAAAMMMIISKYGFADLTGPDGSSFPGIRGADSARIAAQVVSGISFLCAGVIFKNSGTIKGLTTAAGIWMTAGIGLSIGAGMFVVGICATVIVFGLQLIMHRYAVGADSYGGSRLQFTVERGHNFNAALDKQIEDWDARVTESSITRNRDGTDNYDVIVRRKSELTYAEFKSFVDGREDVVSASTNPLHGYGSQT
ncbi:MAG: MgtC/SapB family protein [Oscillospiraceae bacterium]|nr:MgtC/SapB family protein [Oscillospiraceae bacterium]